jgi:hypothetical protein
MIDVSETFSTKILTSKEFLKTLYGITYVADTIPHVEDIRIFLRIYKDPRYPEVCSPSLDIVSDDIDTAYLLRQSILALIRLFNPTRIDTNLLRSKLSGAKVIHATSISFILSFPKENIAMYFPSARERLEIPRYLSSIFQEIGFFSLDVFNHSLAVFS